jgi:hypothetical protein
VSWRWLSHPLLIAIATLAAGAAITYVLVPLWQVSERELDIKFDLAREVSESVIGYELRPLRYPNINYSSSESVNALMSEIVKGEIEEIETCNSTYQRLILYFPGNEKVKKGWSDICASLSFLYIYRILPREADIGNDLFNNMSKTMVKLINNRLDMGFTQTDLEDLSSEENSTVTKKIHDIITNKTQNLMHDIISSDLVGY